MFPKTIHQIWLGKKPFPAIAEAWTASYRRHMPDWEIKRWGDADLPELAGRLSCPHLVLDETAGMGIRCDVLRYEIVRLFGGIYMDHDMEIFRPLDEIVIEDCLHFALSFNQLDAVSNAFFGSPPGHPFWDLLLKDLGETVPARRPENPWDVLELTGYRAVRKALHRLLGGKVEGLALEAEDGWTAGWLFDQADLVAWSREAVHPYHLHEMRHDRFRLEDFPRAYAAHHWQGEWVGEGSEPALAQA
jgi:hypothetical protein